MSDSIPSSEYIQIVRELATLGQKIDNFIKVQDSMKSEIDGLRASVKVELDALRFDIGSVKTDIAEIRTQRKVTMSYLGGIVAAAGMVAWLVGQVAEPVLKKFLGI